MANTVLDAKNSKGDVVVKFLSDNVADSYKLIEVPQVGILCLCWAVHLESDARVGELHIN
jgi:hypothetical protein